MEAGSTGACGIGTDGQTYCWGVVGAIPLAIGGSSASNQAEDVCVGTYSMTAKHCAVPTIVDGGHRFTLLASGAASDCGLDEGGGWLCAGA